MIQLAPRGAMGAAPGILSSFRMSDLLAPADHPGETQIIMKLNLVSSTVYADMVMIAMIDSQKIPQGLSKPKSP